MSSDNPVSMAVWTARPPGARRAGRALLAFTVAALLAVTQLVSTPAAIGSESGAVASLGGGKVWSNASSIQLDAGCDNPNAFYSCFTGNEPTVMLGDPTIGLRSRAAVSLSFDRNSGLPCAGTNGMGSVRVYEEHSGTYQDYAVEDALVAPVPVGAWSVWEVTGRWSASSGSSGFLQAAIWGYGVLDCLPESGLYYGAVELVPTDGEPQDLLDLLPPTINESNKCQSFGGTRVVDSTNQGVRVYAYVHQPSLDELWVCARVQDSNTGERYGGRLVVTPTELDPGVTGVWGVPTVDANSSACTSNPYNSMPGSHPIASGGIGPVDYMVDVYKHYYYSSDDYWVCLRAGAQKFRVVVPASDQIGAGVSTGTVAKWRPDPGTP